MTTDTQLGILLWSQATDWDDFERAAVKIDEFGYAHLWTWDHLYAIFGDPYQPIFEGYASLAAWAKVTRRARLGLLVGANPFRNPGLTAKLATTLDHISGGRAILGIGGAWFEKEHTEYGIEFGASPGTRLGWMDEAVAAMRALLAGETVTSPDDGVYDFADLRLLPPPVQDRLPIMIGGSGGEEDPAQRGEVRRHVECDGQDRDPAAQGRGSARSLRRGRTRLGGDRAHLWL